MGPMCDVRVAEKIQKVDRLKKKFRSEKKRRYIFQEIRCSMNQKQL